MRGSSLTTFLMFLPLIAIPLLAVFGVPEFSPVKASPPTEPQPQGLSVAGLDANATTPAARKPVNGIFDPGPADTNQKAADGLPAASTDPFTDNHSFADNHRRNKMGGWHLPPQQNGKSAGTQPPVPPRPRKASTATTTRTGNAGTMTWRQARQRLNRLGISEFLLQSGAKPDQFHFSCLHPSPDNPRVTRRFEAESSEPLQAVQDVLRQIELRQ